MTRTYVVKLVEGWLTLPDALWAELQSLGWTEGDTLEVEAVGDALIVTRATPPAPTK